MRPDPHTHCPWPPCVSYGMCVSPHTNKLVFFIFIILFICIFIIIFHYICFSGRDYPNTPCFSNSGSDDQDSCRLPGEKHTQQGYCWTERHLQDYTKLLRHCPILNLCLVLGFSFEYFQTQLNLRNWRHRKGKNKTTYGQGRLLYCPKWLK